MSSVVSIAYEVRKTHSESVKPQEDLRAEISCYDTLWTAPHSNHDGAWCEAALRASTLQQSRSRGREVEWEDLGVDEFHEHVVARVSLHLDASDLVGHVCESSLSQHSVELRIEIHNLL